MEKNELIFMTYKKKSGAFVLKLRKKTKLSQLQFANRLGFNRSYISQLETDNVDISLSKFIHICLVFDILPSDIFNDEQKKTS